MLAVASHFLCSYMNMTSIKNVLFESNYFAKLKKCVLRVTNAANTNKCGTVIILRPVALWEMWYNAVFGSSPSNSNQKLVFSGPPAAWIGLGVFLISLL